MVHHLASSLLAPGPPPVSIPWWSTLAAPGHQCPSRGGPHWHPAPTDLSKSALASHMLTHRRPGLGPDVRRIPDPSCPANLCRALIIQDLVWACVPSSLPSLVPVDLSSMLRRPPSMIHFSVATPSQNSLWCEMMRTPPLYSLIAQVLLHARLGKLPRHQACHSCLALVLSLPELQVAHLGLDVFLHPDTRHPGTPAPRHPGTPAPGPGTPAPGTPTDWHSIGP